MGVLDDYEVDYYEFPLTLYRIDYQGSQTTWHKKRGFQAASGFTPVRVAGFQNAVENHLDWYHRQYKSPFISTFGDRQHALRWANRWIARNHGYCWIEEIRIDDDDGVRVFRVKDVVDQLGITTNLKYTQYWSEYLCLHQIPERLVVSRTQLQ
ncbi:hypothetical protein CPB86DRAFT_876454 [Serendipita vermifera]|nr:hypothetical protein CPB86DRAFT_876454 [Serendipita vermifera]